MGDETRPCPHCKAPIRVAARFCGTCGQRVEGAKRSPGAMGRTMVGVSSQDLPAAPSYLTQPQAPVPPRPGPAPVASPPAPVAPQAPVAPVAAHAHALPAAPRPSTPRSATMVGLSGQLPAMPGAPVAPAASPGLGGTAAYPAMPGAAVPAAPVAPAAPPRPPIGQTMLGLSGQLPGHGQPMTAPVAPVPPAPPKPGATMVGIPGQPLQPGMPPMPPAMPPMAPQLGAAPKGGVTMLGMPQTGANPVPLPGRPTAPSQAGSTMLGMAPGTGPQAAMPALPGAVPAVGGRGRVPAIAWISFGLGALALLGAAVAFFLRGHDAPQVQARVVREADAEWLQFNVAGVPEGAKIRLGGQEQALQAGQTRFALAADSLQVGDNAVLADVVFPDGDVHPVRLMLGVDYRIRIDTSPLEAGKPSVDVIVTARPGSEVVLDGEKLELDGEGRGVRSVPIDVEEAATSGTYEHVVRYRVKPPAAEPSVGVQKAQILISTLHIDRPGVKLTTDRDVVEIAGAVAKTAKVTIDGEAVSVNEGRFLHRYPLPAPGEFRPTIVALERGKAPMVRTIELKRVADLAAAAADFKPEPELGYAKIAQNPAIYKGARIDMEGRVYHVNVKDGRSVLQMFARDCPGGQRCPLWVTHPAATHFTVGDWVRVLGTVEGEQQFRAESNEIVRVPKVDAAFLLPVAAPAPE